MAFFQLTTRTLAGQTYRVAVGPKKKISEVKEALLRKMTELKPTTIRLVTEDGELEDDHTVADYPFLSATKQVAVIVEGRIMDAIVQTEVVTLHIQFTPDEMIMDVKEKIYRALIPYREQMTHRGAMLLRWNHEDTWLRLLDRRTVESYDITDGAIFQAVLEEEAYADVLTYPHPRKYISTETVMTSVPFDELMTVEEFKHRLSITYSYDLYLGSSYYHQNLVLLEEGTWLFEYVAMKEGVTLTLVPRHSRHSRRHRSYNSDSSDISDSSDSSYNSDSSDSSY